MIHEIDSIVLDFLALLFIDVTVVRAAGGNTPDTQEGKCTATDELAGVFFALTLKVPVEDCTSNDDGKSEHDELRRNDHGSVEALQCSVDVLDLHDGREDQDRKQKVGDREGDHFPDFVRE